jgi:hypothetical protein
MERRIAKKHRVKWTDRQELNEVSNETCRFWLKNGPNFELKNSQKMSL